MSLAAVGLDLSAGAPASVIAWRRVRCSWPGCPPRSGTRCGIRNKATQRGSRLTQQLALILSGYHGCCATSPPQAEMSSGEPVRQPHSAHRAAQFCAQ